MPGIERRLALAIAIGLGVANGTGVANAEDECGIRVETYSPRYPGGSITSLEAPVPCDSTQIISALVPSETGIHNISINQATKPVTPFQLGMMAGAGTLFTVGILVGPRRAREWGARLRARHLIP